MAVCDLCQYIGENEQMRTKPLSGVLNVTNQCNLRCRYCFVEHNPQRTTIEVARAACEYLLKDPQGEKPSLWFFGGEPMLEFETIVKPIILEYGDRLTWGITTNGTFLTEDVVDFFYDHEVSILLSIDGIKEVQDAQRPFANGKGSFDAVLKNIPYLLLKYPGTMFRATLTKESIPKMNATFDFAEHMGFRNITFVINEDEEYDENDFEEMKAQYNQMALKMMKGSRLMLEELAKSQIWGGRIQPSIYRCGYGTTSVGITVDGKLLPCQELNSAPADLIIGDVFNGIDPEKHNAFLKQALKPNQLPDDLLPNDRQFVENSLCPKHQYFNNGFVLSQGRRYQVLAIKRMYDRLRKLGSHSNNIHYRRLAGYAQ